MTTDPKVVMLADNVWYCSKYTRGDNWPALCPVEGCPKDYGCARDHGWDLGKLSPPQCQGIWPEGAHHDH